MKAHQEAGLVQFIDLSGWYVVNYGFLKMRQLLPLSIINVNVTSSQTF